MLFGDTYVFVTRWPTIAFSTYRQSGKYLKPFGVAFLHKVNLKMLFLWIEDNFTYIPSRQAISPQLPKCHNLKEEWH